MFYHVVMLKLTRDADAAYHAKAAAFGDDFRKTAKGLVSYEYGRNVSDRTRATTGPWWRCSKPAPTTTPTRSPSCTRR